MRNNNSVMFGGHTLTPAFHLKASVEEEAGKIFTRRHNAKLEALEAVAQVRKELGL